MIATYEIVFPRDKNDWWEKDVKLPFFPRKGDKFSVASSLGIELEVEEAWWSLAEEKHSVRCCICCVASRLPNDGELLADGWNKEK